MTETNSAPAAPLALTAAPASGLEERARKAHHYKTIVISDTHMGDPAALAAFLLEFFRHNSCDRLILNGDIIDGWEMMRKKSKPFTEMEARVWDAINDLASHGAEVVYIRGNHDEEIAHKRHKLVGKTPHVFKDPGSDRSAKILFKRCHIFEDSRGRSVFALHGDILDKDLKFLVEHFLGHRLDHAIEDVDALNAELRKLLSGNGRIRRSALKSVKEIIFKHLKRKYKLGDAFIEIFKKKDFDIVLMGHVHIPSKKTYYRPHSKNGENHKIKVINSGDWVENCTFIAETEEGKWHLKHFDKQLRRKDIKVLPSEDAPNKCTHMRGVTLKELKKFQEIWPGKGVDKLSGQFAKHAHNYSTLVSAFKKVSERHNENNKSYIASKIEETENKLFKIAKKLFPIDVSFEPKFEQAVRSALNKKFHAAHFDPDNLDRPEISLEQYLDMMKDVYLQQYEEQFLVPQAA